MRRHTGAKLSVDKRKSSDNQGRLLENNEYNRRVNDSYKKSKTDSDNFDAINLGDIEAAQKIAEDVAKETGYNSNDLYTSTPDFVKEVSYADRASFSRSLANKTSGMKEGETKSLAIYCPSKVYFFEADGYMHGIIYRAVSTQNEKTINDIRKIWKNGSNTNVDSIDSLANAFASKRRRTNINSIATGDGRGANSSYGLSLREQDSYTRRDNERSRSDYKIDHEEVKRIVKELRALYGSNSNDIKHSHKATSDADRVTITKGALAKLKANYQGEKVFNKKDISAALNNIEALNVLSKSERNSLVSKLFEGYNIRLDAEHYEQFSEIMYNKIRARILQESDFELSVEETSIMDEQIVKALNDIVASGKQSTRAKLEYSVSQDGLKEQAEYWRSEYNRASEQIKIRGRILSIAHKIKDIKVGAYVNAAQYKSDIFKHSIEQLGRIEFRGNMNISGTRTIIKNLNEWYDDKNNSLYKGVDANNGTVGRFNNEIKQMMSAIADGDGAFTTQELLTIEKIVSYFVGEIQDYNTILRNGKRVDAKPIAERHIKTAEEAQALKIKCGAIRAISRSPFAVMVADPATLMRQADGYMNGFFTEMFDEMRQGEIKAAVAEMEMTNEYRGFWKNNKAYAKRYNKDTVKVNGVDIPLRHAISLYMTYQRKQAQEGLVYSGFDILDGDKKITVYKGTDEKLDEKQIAEISKKRADELKAQFNEKDLELVSVMERALEECRKLKIEVDMALQHYTNVDKSGYYFPIRRSQIAQNIDMFSIFEGDRVSNLSMNKDIVKGAKNALLIEPVDIVFMRHIKATSLYSGLGVFTDNFNRLYNLNVNETNEELALGGEHSNYNRPKTIKSTLESDKFTKTMAEYFTELKKDIEGISTKEQSTKFFNDAVGYIRSAYAKYQLGANPKVWFTQLSSFFAATNILDHTSIIKGLGVKNRAA